MSKRLGNAVDPFTTIDKYGADATRWYMLTNSQPWDNLKFDLDGVEDTRRKLFMKLVNIYNFFALYAEIDGFDYSQAEVPLETLGTFNSQLAEEFWRAVSSSGLMTLHVVLHHGTNTHHIIEAIFKAAARALREALEIDPRASGIPSTKGIL